MKLFVYLCCLLSVSYFAVEGRQACDLNEGTLMKDVMTCMEHNPTLAMQVFMHMKDPKAMESTDFLCNYKSDIASVAECLEQKLLDCVPEQAQILRSILPTKKSLMDGFQLICDHRDIMDSRCFVSQLNPFMQCYQGQVSLLSARGLANAGDAKKILCSVIRAEEQCFEKNRGTCTEKFITMVKQVLETVFPMKQCSNYPAIDQLKDAIMIHGQPLRFQPWKNQGKGYVIKN